MSPARRRVHYHARRATALDSTLAGPWLVLGLIAPVRDQRGGTRTRRLVAQDRARRADSAR